MPQQIAAQIEQMFLTRVHAGGDLVLFGCGLDVSFGFLNIRLTDCAIRRDP